DSAATRSRCGSPSSNDRGGFPGFPFDGDPEGMIGPTLRLRNADAPTYSPGVYGVRGSGSREGSGVLSATSHPLDAFADALDER
ncbi:MAG: hypothetical protein M3Q29_17930, partial [Chloroflexota bacterium]|nr:hypothetical protein [Chloroflexota bacterium]